MDITGDSDLSLQYNHPLTALKLFFCLFLTPAPHDDQFLGIHLLCWRIYEGF